MKERALVCSKNGKIYGKVIGRYDDEVLYFLPENTELKAGDVVFIDKLQEMDGKKIILEWHIQTQEERSRLLKEVMLDKIKFAQVDGDFLAYNIYLLHMYGLRTYANCHMGVIIEVSFLSFGKENLLGELLKVYRDKLRDLGSYFADFTARFIDFCEEVGYDLDMSRIVERQEFQKLAEMLNEMNEAKNVVILPPEFFEVNTN